jgi:hypothetical protein
MIDRGFAWVLLVVCVVLLVRLAVGERRRGRFDAAIRKAWYSLRYSIRSFRHQRVAQRNAERVAKDVIRRARGGDWDGNVYTPKTFRGKKPGAGKPQDRKPGDKNPGDPPPRDKMH